MRLAAGLLMGAIGAGGAVSPHGWREKVPEQRRVKANPYGDDEGTLRAGAAVFGQRCASCHGENAMGRGRRPSLRTDRVQGATDGELLWLLENGELRYGMPSWSGLPEEQRWQVERYVKSLGVAAAER